MKILINDLNEKERYNLQQNISNDVVVFSNDHKAHECVACFGCWIKEPGTCVIKDHYSDISKMASKCEELIIISKCYYGGFSPFVKSVIDRCIGYLSPFFEIRKGEMHHKMRYENQFKLTVGLYGENITDDEREVAKELVAANGINMDAKQHSVRFYENFEAMRGEFI